MTPLLRPARSTDAGKLGGMITAFVAATDWMPALHTGAEDIAHAGRMIDQGWVTVAEIADDSGPYILGFLARDGALIHSLYIDARVQGAGIGGQLLDDAKNRADELTLWTHQANTGAQRFYDRHGFTEAERSDGSRNDEGLPDIRYHWTRKAAT